MTYYFCPFCGTRYTEDGTTSIYYHCFACNYTFYQDPKPAAVGLIEDSSGNVLLSKRAIPPFQGYWDLPGGFLDGAENLIEGVQRELKEELDLSVDSHKVQFVDSFIEKYANKGRSTETYDALINVFYIRIPDSTHLKALDDISEVQFFSWTNLPPHIAFPEKATFLTQMQHKRTSSS